ncbi:hypothetical protein LX36DRAFT_321548 [Colletotrichum falcatum]|nr:hypothetical protein LX36DRAFT_321548 [Colletotrichum falcatum]
MSIASGFQRVILPGRVKGGGGRRRDEKLCTTYVGLAHLAAGLQGVATHTHTHTHTSKEGLGRVPTTYLHRASQEEEEESKRGTSLEGRGTFSRVSNPALPLVDDAPRAPPPPVRRWLCAAAPQRVSKADGITQTFRRRSDVAWLQSRRTTLG